MSGGGPAAKVLVAGFEGPTTERLSAALRDAGYQVLGASGRSSARTLARVAAPDVVLVPAGPAGDAAAGWVSDLLSAVPLATADEASPPPSWLDAVAEALSAPRPAGGPVYDPAEAVDGPSATSDAAAPPEAIVDSGLMTPAASAPSAPASPGAAVVSASRDTSREAHAGGADLGARLAHVRFGSYHEVLDVRPGATDHAIRDSYRRLRALYTPTGWPHPVRADELPILDEIARGIEDAWSILGSPELGARYERALARAARARRPPAGS